MHSNIDIVPEDTALLPRYNSDVCKWHLFISNLTAGVFQVPKDTFTMDYARILKFQTVPFSQGFSFPLSPKILINFITLDLKSTLPMLWSNPMLQFLFEHCSEHKKKCWEKMEAIDLSAHEYICIYIERERVHTKAPQYNS